MDAKRELVDIGTLASEIKNSDLAWSSEQSVLSL